ncbi:hypothetical protein IAG44_34505 [Streptomyces roseirectus]|uniref:Uncharacterized protein n=1 Tax=Streptomyces roseirectus TaxID=2768066 RepID=A0A7H0IMQ4_9ACTN|nr:hypothetical protein [Streptomyces roseirectus]QNP74070.1 hypothetical protein IAG44_34505 [Streptomyces roseirectus]
MPLRAVARRPVAAPGPAALSQAAPVPDGRIGVHPHARTTGRSSVSAASVVADRLTARYGMPRVLARDEDDVLRRYEPFGRAREGPARG